MSAGRMDVAPEFETMNTPISTPVRHEKTLLIRPEFLNHGGTVFGGYMMQWADDLAYVAASLAYPGANFVTKLFGQFDFKVPGTAGDIIKIYSELESVGTTSCKVQVWAVNARTGAEVFRTFAIMVNLQNGVKIPLKPSAPFP
jgi:acyl-CoA hydrolase